MKLANEELGAIIFERFSAHGLAEYAMAGLKKADIGGAFRDAVIHAIAAERELPVGWELDFDESDKKAGEEEAETIAKSGGKESECTAAFFRARRAHMIFRKLGI